MMGENDMKLFHFHYSSVSLFVMSGFTDESFRSLSFQFRVGISTVSSIIPEVCEAIIDTIHAEFLKVCHLYLPL